MTTAAMPQDPPPLRVTVTEGERCHRSVEVEVPAEFVAAEQGAVLRKYASRVKLRGFRKGRAPARVVLQHHGGDIRREAIDRAVRKACGQALDSRGLRPVSEVDVTDVQFDGADSLSFKASFEVQPQVSLGRLGGFQVERSPATVPDGAVDGVLERLRKERAAWRTVESGRPEPGDSVTVLLRQMEGDDAGDEARQYDLVLGEDQALPDIENAIRTLSIGDAGEFSIAFPDDHPDESRAGSRHRLTIELVSRRVAELPDLDDAFAGSVGDFEDLAALRARIGADIERDVKSRAELDFRERLLNLVVDANPFDVPDAMVEAYTDGLLADAGDLAPEEAERLRTQLRPASEFAVRRELLVERIVDVHGLRATDEEIGESVKEIARQAGQSPSAVRARLRKSGGLSNIERGLTDARLFAFLKEQSGLQDDLDRQGS